jgi:hypothetical protein
MLFEQITEWKVINLTNLVSRKYIRNKIKTKEEF